MPSRSTTSEAIADERRTASLEPTGKQSRPEIATGTIVGRKYRLEELVGRGGMGLVYRAVHTSLRRRVALKLVASTSAEATARLLREARLAATIKSEQVARVFDVGTSEGGVPYVVMEYLEGESLAEVLRSREPLAIDDAVALVREIARGLEAAHVHGIVHRDLKPSNVFLARRADGTRIVKIVDFGVAKELVADPEESGSLTQSSAVLGSPHYMAPEQVRSARDVDARADIWSLGATFYEMLTGKPPFRADTTPGILAAVVADAPKTPSELRSEIPPAIDTLVLRCLAKDRHERWPDVQTFVRALDAATAKSARTPSRRLVAALTGGTVLLVAGTIAASQRAATIQRPIEAVEVTAQPPATAVVTTASPSAAPPASEAEAPAQTSSMHATSPIPKAARIPTARASAPPVIAASAASSAQLPDVDLATADRH